MKATLYVCLGEKNSSEQQKNATAIQIMRELLQQYGVNSFELEIVNVATDPEKAKADGISSTPCVVFVDGSRLFVPIIGDFTQQKIEIASCLNLTTR